MNDDSQETQDSRLEFAIGSIAAPCDYALESAISSTAAAANDAGEGAAAILHEHLKELCAFQLSHLERLADYDYAVVTGFKSAE